MAMSGMMRLAGSIALVALGLMACATPQHAPATASKACDIALHRLVDAHGCDRYVSEAVQSKHPDTIVDAYTYRALLREFMGDLPGALADTDQAIAADPGWTFSHRRRAALLGESGEYEQALKLFADFAPMDPTHSFDENLAMLEYVAGDRTKAAPLFRSAADDYAEHDRDETMAAILRFNAAVIESELRQGDLAPIAAQDVTSLTDTMLPLLKQHRMGEVSDAELEARIARMTGPTARENRCDGYFSIGHRNALAGDAAAAKAAFAKAVDGCSAASFEHHAAKAWLKALES